jgi:hypothetical protein
MASRRYAAVTDNFEHAAAVLKKNGGVQVCYDNPPQILRYCIREVGKFPVY